MGDRLVRQLDLTGVTLFVQDWGALIGLRIAAEQGDRFGRVMVGNGFLPTAQHGTPIGFRVWRGFASLHPGLQGRASSCSGQR